MPRLRKAGSLDRHAAKMVVRSREGWSLDNCHPLPRVPSHTSQPKERNPPRGLRRTSSKSKEVSSSQLDTIVMSILRLYEGVLLPYNSSFHSYAGTLLEATRCPT